MNAQTIAKVLAEAGHGAHQAAVDAVLQPAIHVIATQAAARPGARGDDDLDDDAVAAFDRAMAALPLGASRFGGVPDLPPGVDWPERDGVPMEFIAQVRLDEVAALDPLGRLPATGTLWFFYNSQWDTDDMEGPGCCRVLFDAGPVDALVRATPPHVEWQSQYAEAPQIAPFVHGLATLAFTPYASLPGGIGPFVSPALKPFWQDFHAYHNQAFQPGGAGAPQNHLLGYVDDQDYVDAHAHGTDDQLLFQVDSDDAAEFLFGDCGRLFFLLRKDRLAARDFAAVRVYSELG